MTNPVDTVQPILSVRDLSVSFRRDEDWTSVTRNISFDVNPGQTVSIVGESGSGKSVTALAVMGLLPPRSSRISGSAHFQGRNLLEMSTPDLMRIRGNKMAMIFQEPMTSLNPVMTIGRQISEVLLRHGRATRSTALAETVALLEKVRIPAAARRVHDYPHHFSGGMRQRVMIAMALACNPQLLIADEPTTALDVTIQAQILDLIRTLQEEEGTSVLFITHDMGVVAEISDKTVVMFRGDIVEHGATTDIFSDSKHPYTRSLLSAVPSLGSLAGERDPRPFRIVDPLTGEREPRREIASRVDPASAPVLEVKDLSVRFDARSGLLNRLKGRVHAVERISLEVRAGETLALVGESGCGKSTTGRAILQLLPAAAGQVRLNGQDLGGLSATELRSRRGGAQMIFQDPFASLNPRMRVGDAIAEPMIIHGTQSGRALTERVSMLLERVGMDPAVARRFPHEFSGGQRQRICIARALALEPKLIIADEAVSALDVSIKAQVVNLMLDLQQEAGLSYLFISHDMAVVERISHRVAVMYLGEIVEIGPRERVFSNPQHPYTRRLIDAVPIPDPTRRRQHGSVTAGELKSPVRAPDYIAPTRRYTEVEPGHLVQEWGEEWS